MSMLKVEKSEKYVGDRSSQCGGVGGQREEGEDLAALMEQDLGDYDDSVESFMEKDAEEVSEVSRGYERFYKEEVSSVTASASTLYDFEENSSCGVVGELETVPKAGICEPQNLQFKEIHDVVAMNFQSIEGEHDGDIVESEVSNDGVGAPGRKEAKAEGKSNIVLVRDDGDGEDQKINDGERDEVEAIDFVNTPVKKTGAISDTEFKKENTDDRGSDGKDNYVSADDLLETVSFGKKEAKAISDTELEVQDEKEDLEITKSEIETDIQDRSSTTLISETVDVINAENSSRQIIVSGDPNVAELLIKDKKNVMSGSIDNSDGKDSPHSPMPGTLLYSGTNSEDNSPGPINDQQDSGASISDDNNMTVLVKTKDSITKDNLEQEEYTDTKDTHSNDEFCPTRSSDMKHDMDQEFKFQEDIVSNDKCNTTRSSDVEDMDQEITNQKYYVSDDDCGTNRSSDVEGSIEKELTDQKDNGSSDVEGSIEKELTDQKDSGSSDVEGSIEKELTDQKNSGSSDVEGSIEKELTDQKDSVSDDDCGPNRSSDVEGSIENELAHQKDSVSYDDCGPNRSSNVEGSIEKELTDQKSYVSDDDCGPNRSSNVEGDMEQLTDPKDSLSNDACVATISSDAENDAKQELTHQRDSLSYDECDAKRSSDVEGDIEQELINRKSSASNDECGANTSSNMEDDMGQEFTDMNDTVLNVKCVATKDIGIEDIRDEKLLGTKEFLSNYMSVAKIKEKVVMEESVAGKSTKSAEEEEQDQQESNIRPANVKKKRKVTQSRTEIPTKVHHEDTNSKTKEQDLDSSIAKKDDGDSVHRAVSNVVRVKRKLEEILETSKAEEEAAIRELEKMRREKTQILNKLTSEMVRLKTLLLRDKDRKQEK